MGALILDSFDPTALSGALQRGLLEHTQLARGRFQGRIEHSGDGRTRLDWGRYNLPLLVSGCVAADTVSVGYLHQASGAGSVNGKSVLAGNVAVLGENEELYLRLPPDTEWIALQIPRETFENAQAEAPAASGGVLRPSAEGRVHLDRTVKSLRNVLGPALQGVPDPACVAAAHDKLLCAFLAALGTAHPARAGDGPDTRAHRVRIVRRAQDYAEARLGEPIRMHDLCAAAGASLASLERAFLDLHAMSPKKFLTLHRLSRVRRALILGAGHAATVTDAATACGFFHLGRFAGLYQAFFQETPSATLRLARAA